MLKKIAERGAFVLFGARNVNMKIRWSAELCHMSERGMLKKKASECGVPMQKWAGARSARNPRTGPSKEKRSIVDGESGTSLYHEYLMN